MEFASNVQEFAQGIGVTFKDYTILQQAFVHRSYLNEHKDFPLEHNERLEFLGDAVLELIVTQYLFTHFGNPEGELTNWRAALVNAKKLSEIAKSINIEPYLLLSHGESKDAGTKARDYILANAMESVIGAIYLDQGYDVAKTFVLKYIVSHLDTIIENGLFIDAKSRFQESAQEMVGITPSYRVLEEDGPDHDKHFKVGVFLDRELVASGEGTSKQEAQTDAAEHALKVKGWKGGRVKIIRRDPSVLFDAAN